MESSWKNIFFANLSLKKFEIWVSNLSLKSESQIFGSLKFWNFEILKSWNFIYFLKIYCLNYILRRWGIENYTFSITKQHPNLNMNFISFKKHEMEITLNFLILKDGTLNFNIFKKGTHPTLISLLVRRGKVSPNIK